MSENASEAALAVSGIPMFVAGRPNVTEKRCEQGDFVKLQHTADKLRRTVVVLSSCRAKAPLALK